MNFPARVPALRTARLELRALGAADAPALFAVFSDPSVMRYWSTPPWRDVAQGEALVASAEVQLAEARAIRWGVVERASGALAGTCTLWNLDAQNERAELGYALGAAHWGRGYMHEALTLVLSWGFGPFGLHRVEADTDPRNAASVKLLERLGFVREGLLRERWIVAGEVSDSLMFGLLARDWHARQDAE